MNAYELHAADLASLETELGSGQAAFNWSGADYPCLAGSRVNGKALDIGGWIPSNPLRIVVRTSVFGGGAWPEVNQTIVFTPTVGGSSIELQIENVFHSPGGQQITLSCHDPNTGV